MACASRGLEKAQRKAAEHGIPKAYASGMELIADPDIDLVLNLTTPQAHYEYNLAALKAGKHVYTEKPLAMTFAEGKELVELAKEKGLLIGCAPDTFLGGRLQNIRELIDSGRLGRITGGGAWFVGHGHEFHHPAPAFFYQPGAGPLYDMGPYYVTALLSLLGPVRRVCAMATRAAQTRSVPSGPAKGTVLPVDVDTHINAILEFCSGAQVTLTCSFDVWDSELPRMELYGTEGTVLIDEKDPIAGPNLFGGDTLMRTPGEYRWADPERRPENVDTPWPVCVERGLDPMTANLVVADPERSDKTICLAITPAMKKLGIRNRCRVFEIPKTVPYIFQQPLIIFQFNGNKKQEILFDIPMI